MEPSLSTLVERWIQSGIITTEQGERIRADVATLPATKPRTSSLIAEGLGYLGGAIVVVGVVLVSSLVWDDLAPLGHIGVLAGVCLALVLAGAFVPARQLGLAGGRLRGTLWAGASVALTAALAVGADEQLKWDDEYVALLATAGTAVVSAALWAISRHVLQHIVVVVAVLSTAYAGTLVATDDWRWPNVAVWATGGLWFVLSLPNIVPARAGGVLGSLGTVVGSIMSISEQWGPLLALASVLVLVATGVVRRDLPVLSVGSIGTLIVLPFVVDKYFPGTMSTALTLVVAGLALVTTGVVVSRQRRTEPTA